MAYIRWTDSLVNGDNQTQSHITNLKNDITTVINGGVTDANINASAAIQESKITFNITTGHNHDGVLSRVIGAGNYRAYKFGGDLVFIDTDTIKAQSGTIEINGSIYSRVSYSSTIDLDTNAAWVEGTSQRAINSTFYLYAYNDSGSSWDIKFWSQAPQYADCITDSSGPLRFRSAGGVWYRCLGYVTTNAVGSGNIISTAVYPIELPQLNNTATQYMNGKGLWDTLSFGGRLIKVTVFTSSDTFTKQSTTNAVLVECVGGGGEGYAAGNGGDGGTSSFGAFCSAAGGSGGQLAAGGAGGAGSGGDLNLTGESGWTETTFTKGGNSPMGFGYGGTDNAAGIGYGAGSGGQSAGQGSGGGGGYTKEFITSYTNATETVTVGAGGSGNVAPDGLSGIVIVYEYT